MELREWQYMSKPAGSTISSSSSGYKKRFEKLIKYHIDHASSELESITRKDIKDESFVLREHYNTSYEEFDRDIIVNWDKNTDTFYFSMYINGKHKVANNRISWEQFLKLLDGYMWLPGQGSSEWNDLLTESLTEWQLMNPSTNNSSQQAQATASSTTGGYWKRFNKLIYYHVRHKGPGVDKVVRTKVSKNGFHYTEHHKDRISGYDYDIVVYIDQATESWNVQIYVDNIPRLDLGGTGNGYPELLKELRKHMSIPAEGTSDYDDLLTESLSIADDFKLYENLWD